MSNKLKKRMGKLKNRSMKIAKRLENLEMLEERAKRANENNYYDIKYYC